MKIFDLSLFGTSVEYNFPEVSDKRVLWRVTKCPMQLLRLGRGEPELACKAGGWTINEKIGRAINPKIGCNCIVCPPDPHPEDIWCEFEYILED